MDLFEYLRYSFELNFENLTGNLEKRVMFSRFSPFYDYLIDWIACSATELL